MRDWFCRTAGNYDPDELSSSTALVCEEASLTQQQFRDESDPNTIMAKFVRTGDASSLSVTTPNYGDFTGINDYQTALNAVMDADEAFLSLDAKIRARFNNDPQQLLDFVSDGDNYDEAVEIGLIAKKELSPVPRSQESAVGAGGNSKPPKGARSSKVPAKAPEGDEGDD